MLIFARFITLCVQAWALYLLILNIKACWHKLLMLPLNRWENQIRTRTKIQSTRTLEPRQSKISPWLAKRSPELLGMSSHHRDWRWLATASRLPLAAGDLPACQHARRHQMLLRHLDRQLRWKLIGTTGGDIVTGLPASSLFVYSGYPAVARFITDQKVRVHGGIQIQQQQQWLLPSVLWKRPFSQY